MGQASEGIIIVDLIVIGSGPGGTAAAIRAAQLGAAVTLVERAELGGNCVNRNCIPLNVLLACAERLAAVRRAPELGVEAGPATLNLGRAQARREAIVGELREGVSGLFASYGVEVLRGEARLTGPKEMEVEGRLVRADRAVIVAPGSRPSPPPFTADGILTADQALALTEAPARLLILGGDFVEVELAGLFPLLGSQVTLLAEGEQLLPQEDYEVGQRLQSLLEAQGVQVLTKATLRSLRWEGNTLAATVVTRQGEVAVAADRGIWAGREPATAGLGLDKVGAKLRNGAVAVDRRMATEVPGLYAVGDAVGGGMLSAVATAQGLVAAENALGQRRLFDERAIPRCLHTVPEVASVGLTELQAEDRGYAVEVSNIPFAINARAMALGEVEGTVKIVAEGKYKKILGVHIVGHRASELIGEAALAIQLEATAEDLAWGIRYHPTLAETQGEAARALFSRAIYLPRL